MIKILKNIKKEGRIRIYLITLIMFVSGSLPLELPTFFLKITGSLILVATYIYAASNVAHRYRYAQHKQKGGKNKK